MANTGSDGYKPPIAKAVYGGENGTELFLHGKYIELGISNWGDFGTLGNKPAGFRGTNIGWRGSSKIGMSADHDGFRNGVDLPIDYYLPGCPEERFAVGYKNGDGNAVINTNSAQMNDKNMDTTVLNLSKPSEGLLKAKVVSTWENKMKITQIISFKEEDKFYRNEVTIENLSGESMDNVRYMRNFDPDNTQFRGGSFSTQNDILYQNADAAGNDGIAVVRAQTYSGTDPLKTSALNTNAPIFFYSEQTGTKVSNFGFANRDPYALLAYDDARAKPYQSQSDSGINITHEYGTLASNAKSNTFVYYTSLDNRVYTDVIPDIRTNENATTNTPTNIGETGSDFTVTFNDKDNGLIATKTLKEGLPVTYIDAPSVSGNVFNGWEIQGGANESNLTNIQQNITLKATYSENADARVITFDANAGSFENGSTLVVDALKDELLSEPVSPTKGENILLGWTKTQGGSDNWDFVSDTVNESITLYAKWDAPCTITFDDNVTDPNLNEEILIPDPLKAANGAILNSLQEGKRKGYTFINWNTQADGLGTPYTNSYTVSGNQTLYAIWEVAAIEGTVTIDNNSPIYCDTLTASVSGANNSESLKYQWRRGDIEISGATNKTYTTTADDIGKKMKVVVSTDAQTESIFAQTNAVGKKDINGVDKTQNVVYGFAKDYDYDLNTLLPDVTPDNLGDVTFGFVSSTNDNGIFSSVPDAASISGSTLTLKINNVDSSKINSTESVLISITNGKYNIANATVTVKVVDKSTLSITAEMPNKEYDSNPYDYTGTPTFKNGENAVDNVSFNKEYEGRDATAYAKTATAPTNVGTYNLILTVTQNGYTGTSTVPFEITQKAVKVKAKDKEIKIGGNIPSLTNPAINTDYTVTGLAGADTLGGTLVMKYTNSGDTEVVPKNSVIGTYNIVPSGATVSDNYTITFENGALTVVKATSTPTSTSTTDSEPDPEPKEEKTLEVIETPKEIKDPEKIEVKPNGEAFDKSVEVRLKDDPEVKETIEKALDTFVTENKDVKVYPLDISLYIKGTNTKVQPNEGTSVTITCPIPESLLEDRENLKVVCMIDGKLQVLETKVVEIDGVYCARFIASHFSPYAIVVDKDDALSKINEDKADDSSKSKDETTDSTSGNPKTGDNAVLPISIIAILSVTTFAVVKKKCKA